MKILPLVLDVLEQGRIEGDKFYLSDEQLDRKLYTDVNKVLVSLGGKWNRKTKSHVFSEDIGAAIDNAVLSGEVTDKKKDLQYFPTPNSVVDQLIKLADIQPSNSILEPSAGEGAIAFKLIGKENKVTVCEQHKPFAASLGAKLASVYCCDFLSCDFGGKMYDKVIANPPFTRQQDIDHVNHMIDLCCGRVVSVMSSGVMFRQNRKTIEFRARVESYGGTFINLPEGAFKDSGTMVNTCIVVVDIT